MDIRPAAPDDCRAVWEIATSPAVRAASFDPEPIEYDAHVGWYESTLRSPDRDLLVAVEADEVVGYARFDRRANGSVISIAVRPSDHGRGTGRRLLDAAVSVHVDRPVLAYVKPSNVASVRLFSSWELVDAGDPLVFALEG